jgi:hypothetical protein
MRTDVQVKQMQEREPRRRQYHFLQRRYGGPSVLSTSTSTLRLKPSLELGDANSALPYWGGVARREDGTSGVPERLPMNPCRKRADSEPLVSKASA